MTRAQTHRYLRRQRRRQAQSGFITCGTRSQLARLQEAAFDGHYCQVWRLASPGFTGACSPHCDDGACCAGP